MGVGQLMMACAGYILARTLLTHLELDLITLVCGHIHTGTSPMQVGMSLCAASMQMNE